MVFAKVVTNRHINTTIAEEKNKNNKNKTTIKVYLCKCMNSGRIAVGN